MFIRKGGKKAQSAGELVKSAGFLSKGEVIYLARDGNIAIFPLTSQDI